MGDGEMHGVDAVEIFIVEGMLTADLGAGATLDNLVLGYLNPAVPFDELFARISKWAAFTPLNNATGSPAIAVPAGLSESGVPLGVQLSGRRGGEGVLLELAYALEFELSFPAIHETPAHRQPDLQAP